VHKAFDREHSRIGSGNVLKISTLRPRKGDGKVILRCILGKQVMRM
jgi:hypothetical protein